MGFFRAFKRVFIWLGLMALVVFYAWLGWIGGTGRVSLGNSDIVPHVTGMILVDAMLDRNWEVFKDALRHIVMPALILATTTPRASSTERTRSARSSRSSIPLLKVTFRNLSTRRRMGAKAPPAKRLFFS